MNWVKKIAFWVKLVLSNLTRFWLAQKVKEGGGA